MAAALGVQGSVAGGSAYRRRRRCGERRVHRSQRYTPAYQGGRRVQFGGEGGPGRRSYRRPLAGFGRGGARMTKVEGPILEWIETAGAAAGPFVLLQGYPYTGFAVVRDGKLILPPA